MARLKEAQQCPTEEQPVVGLHESRREAHGRPQKQDHGIEEADVDAIRQESKEQAARREGQSESELQVAVLLVGQPELPHDPAGRRREREPVHVVDRGRQEQEDADAPAPGLGSGASGAAHPFQELPSHARTRSRNVTESSVKARKSFSPFSAVA